MKDLVKKLFFTAAGIAGAAVTFTPIFIAYNPSIFTPINKICSVENGKFLYEEVKIIEMDKSHVKFAYPNIPDTAALTVNSENYKIKNCR